MAQFAGLILISWLKCRFNLDINMGNGLHRVPSFEGFEGL